jgi:uncharacterized alkaline shock family protein YloU
MSIFDKFLLALVFLLLLALSLFAGCVALSIIPLSLVCEYLISLAGMWHINGWILGGIALVLFVVVIRLFVASYGGKGRIYTRLAVTENGEIEISIPTIRQISGAFIATKPEILASNTTILPAKDGLTVLLRICVKEGSLLPDTSTSIQKELKAHLETVTGLAVKRVQVRVDNNRSDYAGKGR